MSDGVKIFLTEYVEADISSDQKHEKIGRGAHVLVNKEKSENVVI